MDSVSLNRIKILQQFINQNALDAIRSLSEGCDFDTAMHAGAVLADMFGDRRSYETIADDRKADLTLEQRFIASFHKNLNLLIEKTWVEKTDEALKAQVQYRLLLVYQQLQNGDYTHAYPELLSILYDALYLMFGADAREPEFIEYALRIDPSFGIFWWFMFSMPEEVIWSESVCRIVMLLFMLFIANY